MDQISWSDFERIDMRVGTIIKAEDFPEAKKPAYKLTIDFGPQIGVRKSSAQITAQYQKKDLLGKQVVAVVNFPPKQIGPVMSECLVLGALGKEGVVTLLQPERNIENGQRIA